MNPKTDFFFNKPGQWQAAYQELRMLALDCGLNEELKWGCPCYTINKSNVVLIHGFKEYCALLFMKGALLKNSDGLLIQQTENVQAARQLRFTSAEQIIALAPIIKAHILDAVEVEKSGVKVVLKKNTNLVLAEEFQTVLDETPAVKSAFEALTPGRQRAYNLYFSAAKQAKTRVQRIEKSIQQILDGKGLND